MFYNHNAVLTQVTIWNEPFSDIEHSRYEVVSGLSEGTLFLEDKIQNSSFLKDADPNMLKQKFS